MSMSVIATSAYEDPDRVVGTCARCGGEVLLAAIWRDEVYDHPEGYIHRECAREEYDEEYPARPAQALHFCIEKGCAIRPGDMAHETDHGWVCEDCWPDWRDREIRAWYSPAEFEEPEVDAYGNPC